MANTRFEYMYRSASNHKLFEVMVLPGHDPEQIAVIRSCLSERETFIPYQVGLRDLQHEAGWNITPDEDHVWHELVEIRATDAAPHLRAPALGELSERFARVTWDPDAAQEVLFGAEPAHQQGPVSFEALGGDVRAGLLAFCERVDTRNPAGAQEALRVAADLARHLCFDPPLAARIAGDDPEPALAQALGEIYPSAHDRPMLARVLRGSSLLRRVHPLTER